MSMDQVVERILSDAKNEAEHILAEANVKADSMLAAVSVYCEKELRATEADVKAKVDDIFEKKAATARLDGAKLLLSEKRKTLDAIYGQALQRLLSLNKEDCLRLYKCLLETYAENGDEVYFAENFNYATDVEQMSIGAERNLKVMPYRLALDGGMRLCGQKSDKDLSFGALLAADKEKYQTTLTTRLFNES